MAKQSLFLLFVLFAGGANAQDDTRPYTSKMANLGEIQLEYMDFGGEGTTFIWVQDFHNYFEGPYTDTTYYEFFAKISEHARVVAPLKRGYGKSTNTEWGYDVATLSQDLIRFMNALGIEKAVLFGRVPGNQEMTYIAEHYPDRLAGLIYWGSPFVILPCADPDERLIMDSWGSMAPDFDKEKEKRVVLSRAYWRPDYLFDETVRIDVPALRIINPMFENATIVRNLVERGMVEQSANMTMEGYEEEIQALKTLIEDSVRYNNLKRRLIECDPTEDLKAGMERAFGDNLETINEMDYELNYDEFNKYLSWLHDQILPFLQKVDRE